MSAFFSSYAPKCHLYVMLATACLVLPLSAQTETATPAAKPKVKLAPRPLPGMGSSNSNADSPSPEAGPDVASAEAEARAKVPLFRPASVKTSSSAQVKTLPADSNQIAAQQSSDRARIMAIRRRGTFQVPKEPAREPSVIVNDLGERAASVEAVPVALPPGKIRVIPREKIIIGTPPPQP